VTPADGKAYDRFGYSIAFDGSNLAVSGSDKRKIYLYSKDGTGAWLPRFPIFQLAGKQDMGTVYVLGKSPLHIMPVGGMIYEGGGSLDYQLVLDQQPSANVTVTIQVSPDFDPGGVTVKPVKLDFNPSNWDQPQTITVLALNDGITQTQHSIVLGHSVAWCDGARTADLRLAIWDAGMAPQEQIYLPLVRR